MFVLLWTAALLYLLLAALSTPLVLSVHSVVSFDFATSQLPVGHTDDPFEALIHQDPLQSRYTGGTVLHLYMREKLSSAAACNALVQRALSRFRLPYLTVTPTFSICPVHGYLAGEHEFCPRCDEALLAGQAQATA